MDTKNALYAAVGAPIAVAKTINTRLEALRAEVETRTGDLSDLAQRQIDEWAAQGRDVVSKVSDKKVVDELTAKVDFDSAREQVHKLRDQLEDMLATWRTSFRPAQETVASAAEAAREQIEEATAPADKAVQAKTTTRPASQAKAAKKAPAKKSPGSKSPAKKAPAKTSS